MCARIALARVADVYYFVCDLSIIHFLYAHKWLVQWSQRLHSYRPSPDWAIKLQIRDATLSWRHEADGEMRSGGARKTKLIYLWFDSVFEWRLQLSASHQAAQQRASRLCSFAASFYARVCFSCFCIAAKWLSARGNLMTIRFGVSFAFSSNASLIPSFFSAFPFSFVLFFSRCIVVCFAHILSHLLLHVYRLRRSETSNWILNEVHADAASLHTSAL